MIKLEGIQKMNDKQKLEYLLLTLEGQLSSERNSLANLSNASALIYAIIDRLNWAGFYFIRGEELVLGPFQGRPACNRIKVGTGVCGTAASTRKTQVIPNVHDFPGHIACDSASNSELVVPIVKDSKLIGVLDLDSPELERFTNLEVEYFERFVQKLNKYLDWSEV